MILVLLLLFVVYFFCMMALIYGFNKVPNFSFEETVHVTKFSIVIPFRNEAANLPALLSSFQKMGYPIDLFEIILVNDDSEDISVDICNDFIADNPKLKMKLVHSERKTGSPKKDAVETGIGVAEFPYILTTDADCIVPEKWLMSFSSFMEETGADMIAGPVVLKKADSILSRFQEIDLLSLQAATIGGFGVGMPFMCNGANLCYRKEHFVEVEGFRGNENIASGDDLFLLEKFRAAGLKTVFLKSKDAIVVTNPQPHLRSLFAQRIRWAAKTSAYSDLFPKGIGLAVFLMNLLIVAATLLWAGGLEIKQYLVLAFLVKFNIDFMLIYRAENFFERESSMKNYFWASALYPFFCCTVVLFAGFRRYEWKGRKFRK